MKCAVIGTSNSIMKGNYLSFFRKISDFAEIRNFSVGGTPSTILPYTLVREDLSDCDVAILETSVNDLWLIRMAAISPERVARYMSDTLAHLNRCGILPVILVLPVNSDVPEIAALRRMAYQVAAAHNAVLLDGYSVMEAVQSIAPGPRDDLFEDASHIGSGLAEIMACELQKALETALTDRALPAARSLPDTGRPSTGRPGTGRPDTRRPDYPYAFASALPNAPMIVEKKSSLFAKSYARLTAGQSLDFVIEAGHEVIGFAMNVTACSAIVEATIDGVGASVGDSVENGGAENGGAEKRYYDFRFSGVAENQTLTFYHSLSPNPQPFTARHLRLRVCHPDEGRPDEWRPDEGRPDEGRADDRQARLIALPHARNSTLNVGTLELEGLILRKGHDLDLAAPDRETSDPEPSEISFDRIRLSVEERLMALEINAAVPDKRAANAVRLLREMFHAGRDYGKDQRPDLLRDIGRLLLEAGDRAEAIRVLAAAHKERPGGAAIKQLLDQASNPVSASPDSASPGPASDVPARQGV